MNGKVINRSIKKAYIKTKENAERISNDNQGCAEEYGYDSAKNIVSETSHITRSLAIDKVNRYTYKNNKNITENKAQSHAKQSILNKTQSGNKTSITVIEKIKELSKAGVSTVKNTIATSKVFASILLSTGVVAVVFTMIVCSIGLVMGSSFGILMATENTGSEYTLNEVITIINKEYFDEIENIKTAILHDDVVISGEEPDWKNVLAVYAVKLTTDQNGAEVVTINDEKIGLLKEIFWDMTEVNYKIETYEDIEIIEITDDEGNQKQQEIVVLKNRLTIYTINKAVAEISDEYGFNEGQNEQLHELLEKRNDVIWSKILQGQ